MAEVLFSVEVGRDLHVVGGPEQAAWGPTDLAVDGSGMVWIADGPTSRLVGYNQQGAKLQEIDLANVVTGLSDIEAGLGVIAVLDIAALTPRVLVVDPASGQVRTTIEIPSIARLENGLSGIAIDSQGSIMAELEGGTRLVKLGSLTDEKRCWERARP